MRVESINDYKMSHRYSFLNAKPHNINTSPRNNIYQISFGQRNIHQIAEFTPECTGTGLPEMAQGGEGVVGFELGESLNKYEKIAGKSVDDRKFFPIWNHANPKGLHKFLIHPGVKTEDLPDTMEAKYFVTSDYIGQTKEEYAKAHKLFPTDLDYVVQSKPNGNKAESKSKYNIIEPTNAKGIIEFPSSKHFGEMEEVPYQIFKLSENNPSYVRFAQKGHNYFIYTPEWARTSKPYSYDCWGNASFDAEIVNSNGMRALAKTLATQMDTEEFGYYKPASFVAHDRPASTFMVHLANMSANGNKEVNGMKAHKVEHNPSFDYQGRTDDPFKMISVVSNEKDITELRKHPQYSVVEKANKYGLNSPFLSDREKEIAKSIIEPYVEPFRDYFGGYNITKVPIIGVKRNPNNFSLGSVSWHFDAEMKNPETPDAAKGLTGDYASIPTKPVANGVTIANLRFDERDAQFGRGDNGLSLVKNTKKFTPFKYDGTNIEEVLEAKEKNARWLTNLMYKAGKQSQEALNKLFFNKDQIESGQKVMGYLSPLKDGEIIIFGLGRPDTQKGFPISTGAALHFFKRKDIPQEMKLKVKFLFGAGKWSEGHPHYKAIERDWKEICKLDGGIYKHNFAYIDGFTPNRLNACTHYGGYTSEYEMFGITPIEAKAAGSPSSVTATGGFLDYTKDGVNGFTTKDVVMGKPEKYGLTYADSPEKLEKARINHQIPQVSDNYKRMIELYTNDKQGYIEMCRKNLEEKVDWHNNAEYNHGMSANRRYLDVIFESNKGWGARYKGKMHELVGKWGKIKENLESAIQNTNSRPARIILGFTLAMLAIGSGIYMYILHSDKKANKQTKKAA